MDINQSATFLTKLDQLFHEYELYLDNGEQQFPINPNAVVNLSIQDTLAEWVVKGTMSFYYYPEASSNVPIFNENTGNYSTARTGIRSTTTEQTYNFKNDGTDYLRIRITPNNDNNAEDVNNFIINDKTHWTLSYLFSIYNIEDIDLPTGQLNHTQANLKCLKIFFWDHWFQKLITNLIEYSTAESPSGLANIEADKAAGIYSNYGMIPTGIAIKDIIEKGLEGLPTAPNPVGTGPEEWEDGKSRIFYTTPAQTTAYDSLDYVYRQHLSSIGFNNIYDFSILVKEKGPEPQDLGYFTLRPLSYYFKQSTEGSAPGKWQIEHFFLMGFTGETGAALKTLRAPISFNQSDTVDVKIGKYNQITNFRFVDIATILNENEFCSSPIYSYDFKNRIFRTEFEQNTIYNARDFITEQYIKKLYNGGDSSTFLPQINPDKEKNNLKPAFSLYGDTNPDDDVMRQLPGIHKLLYYGVFQNACINFRTLGLTHREPGRFIAIDRVEGALPGIYEDKLFGQWFVIDVKHVIETEMYYNDITAVKINRSSNYAGNYTGDVNVSQRVANTA